MFRQSTHLIKNQIEEFKEHIEDMGVLKCILPHYRIKREKQREEAQQRVDYFAPEIKQKIFLKQKNLKKLKKNQSLKMLSSKKLLIKLN